MNGKRRMGNLPALALAVSLLAAPAFAEDEAVATAGDVAWVSGGVGEESRERLNALSAGFGFNLKLTFALASGDYLSAVAVRIVDAGGRTVLETTSEGPILLARLPAGRYECFATVGGRELKQRLTVAEGRLGATVFRWPAGE